MQSLNPSKADYDPSLTPHDIFEQLEIVLVMNIKVLCLYLLTLTMNYILEDQ